MVTPATAAAAVSEAHPLGPCVVWGLVLTPHERELWVPPCPEWLLGGGSTVSPVGRGRERQEAQTVKNCPWCPVGQHVGLVVTQPLLPPPTADTAGELGWQLPEASGAHPAAPCLTSTPCVSRWLFLRDSPTAEHTQGSPTWKVVDAPAAQALPLLLAPPEPRSPGDPAWAPGGPSGGQHRPCAEFREEGIVRSAHPPSASGCPVGLSLRPGQHPQRPAQGKVPIEGRERRAPGMCCLCVRAPPPAPWAGPFLLGLWELTSITEGGARLWLRG